MLMSGSLQSRRRQALSNHTFEEIRRYIVRSRLQAGDRLPTEAEMSAALSLSRNSVREMLKCLEFIGVVSGQSKNGYIVQPFTMRAIADQIMLQFPRNHEQIKQIVECRHVLERACIDLALRNVKEWDYDRMERHLTAAERCLHAPEDFEDHCARFHDAVFGITGNDFLRGYYDIIAGFFRCASVAIPIGPTEGRVSALQARHDLLTALRQGDREAAVEAVDAYVSYYERPEVLKAMAETLLSPPDGDAD